jgi:hypothetical protein
MAATARPLPPFQAAGHITQVPAQARTAMATGIEMLREEGVPA